MIPDNETQFKLAAESIENVWGQILTETDVVSFSPNHDIHWEFIVRHPPWMEAGVAFMKGWWLCLKDNSVKP